MEKQIETAVITQASQTCDDLLKQTNENTRGRPSFANIRSILSFPQIQS